MSDDVRALRLLSFIIVLIYTCIGGLMLASG
jgi:hypothetical protein